MVIAGFDPGSKVFGIGIIKYENGEAEYVFSKEIKFPNTEFDEKMVILMSELDTIFKEFSPDETAIEDGFMGKNVKSMNILSKIRGVVLANVLLKKKKMKFYSPREVKISMTGSGNASKDQVNRMVKHILKIGEKDLGNDESDALAVAYCHGSHLRTF